MMTDWTELFMAGGVAADEVEFAVTLNEASSALWMLTDGTELFPAGGVAVDEVEWLLVPKLELGNE
jgi:hypothetical protein